MTGTDKQLRDYVKNIFNNEDFKIVEMVHSRLNDAVQVTFKYQSPLKNYSTEDTYLNKDTKVSEVETEFTEVKS